MNSTQNTSRDDCVAKNGVAATDVQTGMRVFIAVCLSIIIAVSFLGNLLVCVAFKVNKNLRIVSNFFILSLAISDLITTIFVMPFDVDIIVKLGAWNHGDTMCKFFTTVYLISAPASILNLLAVSIDRFRLISDPFAYERTTTPSRALVVVACVWVYATIMALLPVMGWTEPVKAPFSNCTQPVNVNVCHFPIPTAYSIMISVLHFVIPPLVMTVIYFKIYQIARSHVRRIHRLESITAEANHRASLMYTCTPLPDSRRPSSTVGSPLTKHGADSNGNTKANGGERKVMYTSTAPPTLRKNVKAAKSLAVIVGTFFACWYPFTLVSMGLNACGGLSGSCTVPPVYVMDCLLTVGYMNSMLNPFLYALHNKEFKKTYKRILRMKY